MICNECGRETILYQDIQTLNTLQFNTTNKDIVIKVIEGEGSYIECKCGNDIVED